MKNKIDIVIKLLNIKTRSITVSLVKRLQKQSSELLIIHYSKHVGKCN